MSVQENHGIDELSEYKQRPIKHSFCVSFRRNVHWKCLILSLLIFGCLYAIAWCRLAVVTSVEVHYERNSSEDVDRSNPCEDGYIYIPISFVILLYLVYLVECWHCHTRIELKHKVDVPTVYHKMRQMREALPIVWWKAVCYHYVRKTRQVTRYRNGDSFTSTQVYYERVNSHTAGCAFNFGHCGCKDISKFVTGLEDYSATKIKFSKSFSFIHTNAKYEFDEQRNQFFGENERRDDYMETREGMDLLNVNFKDYMMTFKDPDNLPWYVSNVIFWISSFFLLSWPLRVIIEYKTAYIHYHVHKIFGTNYLNTDRTLGNEMIRVNTIGSAELDMIVRNNFTVVPSYSEALLMNGNGNETSLHTIHDANANVTSPVLGPIRSFTWNNISQSCSSGYISGFLSSSNTPDVVHSTSFGTTPTHAQFNKPDNSAMASGLSNSLRSILLSSWHRKCRNYRSTVARTKAMFTFSNPNSENANKACMDSERHMPRNSMSCGEILSQQVSFLKAAKIEPNTSLKSTGFKREISGLHVQSRSNSFSSFLAMQPIKEILTPPLRAESANDSNVKYSKVIPSRPSVILEDQILSESNLSKQKISNDFTRSKLPNVSIANVLSESASSINTLSSPPGYEEALSMKIPSSTQPNCTENTRLISNRRTSHRQDCYCMETSL